MRCRVDGWLVFEGFVGEVVAGDFFEKVETHYCQQFLGVLVEEAFVVVYVFVVGFCDALQRVIRLASL